MDVKRNIKEIYLEASHFLKKVYPDFVTSRRPEGIQGIPVFTFHSIRPEIFEEQLEFLKDNNYVTVGTDDFYNYLSGKATLPERAILLTMDDGRKSVWTYGFPILKKYGFCATVFVIPGHTKEKSSELGVQSPEREISNLNSKDKPDNEEILSWQEIKIMKDSRLVDFGSHTLFHHKIFTGPEIVDFVGPSYSRRPYDYPAGPLGFENSMIEEDPSNFFGMPIYSNDSLMAGKPRFIDDPEFRKECIRYYGEKFSNPPLPPLSKGGMGGLWKKELFRFSADYRRRNSLPVRFSAADNTEKEIFDNLHTSKKILEERLEKPVNHLCYPFGIWSELSAEMAKKAGYLSAFCAYIPDRPMNKSGDDPCKIVRLKDDYIFRLPGKGRKSLSEIFLHKFWRRLKGERVY